MPNSPASHVTGPTPAVQISGIELFLLDLPLHEPFVASHGETLTRTIAVVRVTGDGVIGWGECSALPAATYTAESAAGSFAALADKLGPRLIGRTMTPQAVVPLLFDGPEVALPMAASALEMAVLDASLRSTAQSLASWLGTTRATVPAGVSLGLADPGETVAKAVDLAAEGYNRLKVKVQPGHDLELASAIRAALPDIELQLDANGAYGAEAIDHVLAIIECGIDAFEQPFAKADERAAIELIGLLAQSGRPPIPVVADEAVESTKDAIGLLERGVMTGLSIKPGRVGGLIAAVNIHDLCRAKGLPATAGGMLETGLGRHALAALAGLDGFTLTGDLSPAGRWLAADPWPDLVLGQGRIAIHQGPGVAPDPDEDVLERFTVERCRVSNAP
ncbi:MAG: enolase C-terminal domain-like protein [Acidimicrobiales bacterium]